MTIQNLTTLLQSMADVRNWTVRHIPIATTLVGYDLFLKLGNDHFAGLPVTVPILHQQLPHAPEVIDAALEQMRRDGLLDHIAAPDGSAGTIVLSERFIDILAGYRKKFESLFILRKRLRDEQFMVACDDAELSHFATALYDHYYDLGWLYLHNYGAVCFLIASLTARIARSYGYEARIESGHAEIAGPGALFRLGSPGFAQPGQVDGHAVCIVSERLILDFGLGNVRKNYRRDFPWALGCDYRPAGNVSGAMTVWTGETVTWKTDWRSPGTDEQLAMAEPLVDQLFRQYQAYYG